MKTSNLKKSIKLYIVYAKLLEILLYKISKTDYNLRTQEILIHFIRIYKISLYTLLTCYIFTIYKNILNTMTTLKKLILNQCITHEIEIETTLFTHQFYPERLGTLT